MKPEFSSYSAFNATDSTFKKKGSMSAPLSLFISSLRISYSQDGVYELLLQYATSRCHEVQQVLSPNLHDSQA